MVSPVRVRVPPLPALAGFFLFKLQTRGFSYVTSVHYSGLFRSFPDNVAVRVAVKLSPCHLLAIPRRDYLVGNYPLTGETAKFWGLIL
jgi:hypothetical protein